jgi:DNA-directed RNA polymerase subunit RPC12/RpoP
LKKVAAADADCTTTGKEQHYVCDGCGKIFSDSKGTKEITDTDSLIIPAVGHKESKWKTDADVHWNECTVKGCGAVTTEKEAHEFNQSGKCTVCGFKTEKQTEPAETTVTPNPDETDSEPSDTSSENGTPGSDHPDTNDTRSDETAPAPETSDVSTPGEDGESDTVMLIVMIVSGIIAIVCVVIVIVVLAKKKKK